MLVDEDYSSDLCGDSGAIGNIDFSIVPTGWSKEKEIIITYRLLSGIDGITNYNYSYNFDNDLDVSNTGEFNKNVIIEKFKVNKNGIINASIDNGDNNIKRASLIISKIDNESPTSPVISLDASGNVVFSGSSDNVTVSDNIIYKGSIDGNNYDVNFTNPLESSTIYAIAVDDVGNVSNTSSKKFIVENSLNGSVNEENILIGYKCSYDGEIYATNEEATKACTHTETKSPNSNTVNYCMSGYTYNSSTYQCEKSGTVTRKYYCSNTGSYQTSSVCGTRYNQSSCSSGWSATENGNCTFSCGAFIASVYSYCSGTARCGVANYRCYSSCSGAYNDENCRRTYLGGNNCVTLSKLYTCRLYGSLRYYCSLTGKYTTSYPSCKETVSVSSNTTYSCPSGYTSNDSNITSSSVCTKTYVDSVSEVIKNYYSCSLHNDVEYENEEKANLACTNYCNNSSTKYFDDKGKCIDLN